MGQQVKNATQPPGFLTTPHSPSRNHQQPGALQNETRPRSPTTRAVAFRLCAGSRTCGVELFYNVAVTPWFHLTPDPFSAPDPRRVSSDRLLTPRW